MSLVEFSADIYPYCKGDVVDLNKKEKARVDAVVERRNLTDAYTPVKETKSATPHADSKDKK